MARPDSTPPDDSLFPIAPCYTAELDAKALDEIRLMLEVMPDQPKLRAHWAENYLLPCVVDALKQTGREV